METEKRLYAGFWVRVLAMFVDTLCLIPIILFFDWLLPKFYSVRPLYYSCYIFFRAIVPAALILWFWRAKSATPGKMLVSVKIVDAKTGGPAMMKQLIIRYLSYFLSFIALGLGYLWVAFDPKKQGWHDKIAGTAVVRVEDRAQKISAVKIVLIALTILLASGVAGIFLVTRSVKGILKNGDALQQEAALVGAKHDSQLCVAEALRKDQADTSFTGRIYAKAFLKICLQQSGKTENFCEGVPDPMEFMKVVSWNMARCRELAPNDLNCAQIIAEVATFCSEQRKIQQSHP